MTVHQNLTPEDLLTYAIQHKEGKIASNGALCVTTGNRTGRSPKDRFIVRDSLTEKTVNWGEINQPISPKQMDLLWQDALEFAPDKDQFINKYQVGTHPQYHLTVTVHTHLAWQALFCDRLFISLENPPKETDWALLCVPEFIPDAPKYNLPGTAAIVLDFSNQRVLICGTLYAGEMKKSMFSVMNYILPDKDILPMHCSATRSKDNGTVALYFGLSGTGKTTLSSGENQLLIGDDEHGWGKDGIFNFEGGCYAKCINLTQENEPLIWNAIRRGSIVENVVLNSDNFPDFADSSITTNTRTAYPIEYIPHYCTEKTHPTPSNVVFLTCDLYGVLPPLSMLTPEQTRFYFLSGYTALVGSTEFGQGQGIKPTFSHCFGAPFFSRPPKVYADLLEKRIQESNTNVFLVNTGWHGGEYGQGGKRFSIKTSRCIIDAINDGTVERCEYEILKPFNLLIPKSLGNIPSTELNPKLGWDDATKYEIAAHNLIEQFQINAQKKSIPLPTEFQGSRYTNLNTRSR